MITKQQINIFLNNQPSNKNQASSIFSNPNNECHVQRQNKSSLLSKRENFSNQIRRKQKQQIRKNMRSQIMKSLHNDNIFEKLQQMANKNSIDTKNISDFLTNLKQSISQYDFCAKLKQSQLIKQYLLDLYILSKQSSTIQQKSLLIHILIYLTYYGSFTLDQGQKQKLIDEIISQLQKINKWNFDQMDYLNKLIDLLTNITADKDENFNLYLVDTKIFYLIAEKLTQIMDQAQKITRQSQDKQIQQKYIDQLNFIRESFLGTLINLSKYQNEFFFKFAVNQLVNDRNYIESFPIKVVQIFINFFQHEKFTTNFLENQELFLWFQDFIPFTCQKKFQNFKQKRIGRFQNIILSQNEKQLFYQFLCCLMIFVYNQGENYQQVNTLIEENINLFCLSEFLIQSAGNGDEIYKIRRNSVYVSKAIQIYEYLACSPSYRSLQNLLKVTFERTFEDIIKVLLDKTYFTSCKISDVTLSLLNKIISKDNQMLSTFMELRILDSIDSFLEGDIEIQTKQQIINFLELLTLMIVAQDQQSRKDKKTNQIVRLLQMKGFIKRIQRYQDHKAREVSDKVEAFLSHVETYRQGNSRFENVIEI